MIRCPAQVDPARADSRCQLGAGHSGPHTLTGVSGTTMRWPNNTRSAERCLSSVGSIRCDLSRGHDGEHRATDRGYRIRWDLAKGLRDGTRSQDSKPGLAT